MNAPAAGAAYSRPTTPAPPPSTSVPMAGNSARGVPNTMALMSMSMMPCSIGARRRNAMPSRKPAHDTGVPPPSGGCGRMRPTATRAAAKVHRSMR